MFPELVEGPAQPVGTPAGSGARATTEPQEVGLTTRPMNKGQAV